jgi:cell division protein FtsN
LPPAAAKPAPAAPATGTYYLQVGSFSDAVKAERFKAELGMLGLQTSIQKVTINNKDTYHRVRVGPFGTLDELDRTRKRLKKQGIDSTPIKVRG